MIEKTVIINRAVPGSGKTTITNYIVDELKRNNLSVSVHSTDEYFMVGNKYIFDLEKLGEYHNKNLESFKKSILDDTNVVICDNTNIAPWQAEPYTKLAREYNYNIIFISLNPRELDKHIASQKVTAEKPDAHGVHEDILKMMMKEYYIYDDLLNKNMVINEQTQINYKWHEILNKKIQVDIATYFDNDYVIRILPNEYQMAQNTIGTNILKLINGDKKKYSSNPSNQELSNITKKDQLKNSPLHIAIIFNDIESIRFLLNQGFDINIKDNNGLTALEFAFFKENYRIIKELYAFFPNEIQNYILNNWISSLPLATYLENLIIMKLLIEKGADLNIKSEQGESPLHIAINSDNFELVKFLVESKVDLDIEDNYGNTPIMVAFKKNNIKIIKYLIAQHNKIKPISRKIISAFYAKIDTKEYIETLEIFLQMININVNEKVHFDFFKQIFIKNISDIDKSIIRIFIDNGIDINSKLDKNSTIIQYARNQSEKYAWFINLINERSNNNPHHLIELLSTFTIKKPIKFSTHEWDNNLKSNQYKNFDLYMNTIKNQFNSISQELKQLSPNLYKKIFTFLIDRNPSVEYSWCSRSNINIGWSNLKGLDNWVNSGRNPFDFKLLNPILLENNELTLFGEIINLFKQEIEIRSDFKNLESIFTTQRKKLCSGRKAIFNLDLSSAKLLNRQFYTDTEKFSNVIDKIFREIKKREDFPNIKVTTLELYDRSIEIIITQIGSSSSRSPEELIQRAKEKGDISDIKESLTNLCDYSIKSNYENNGFRVNFLHSNNLNEIENLEQKAIGFSHIFRFYK